MNGISVVICCYNSIARIRPTLEHLSQQKGIEVDKWEVIVVDNASKDDTARAASDIWHQLDVQKDLPSFKVIKEMKPGLSNARNTGIKLSVYSYVLFCDDDNWLSENYLSTALEIISSNPLIGVLGGIGHPVFEDKEPPYFWKNQCHALAVGEQYVTDGDITDTRPVVYGAGMILNKKYYYKLLNEFHFEFSASDRIGNSLISSGDHELCLAVKRIGGRVYYSKRLTFKHYMPKSRTTITYYIKLFTGYGMSLPLLQGYYLNKDNITSIKSDYRYIALRSLKNIFKSWGTLFVKGYYWSNCKYKYVGHLHSLYTDIGILKMTLVVKNAIVDNWCNVPLFKYNGNAG